MALAQEEFSVLALAQMDTVYRMARRLSHDVARADDLVQETYLRAIRFRGSFELREFGIRPWLMRILHHVHFSQLTREAREPLPAGDFHPDAPSKEIPLPNSDDPHGLETMDERLVKAIDSLHSPYRDVLLLWAVEDLTYQEIAKALCVPVGTVMSRLHRARKLVRERIGDCINERGAWQGPVRV